MSFIMFTLASCKGCSDVSFGQDSGECHFLTEGGEKRTSHQLVSQAVGKSDTMKQLYSQSKATF